MVDAIETDDGTAYQCERCGERFDRVANAAEHESSCGPPRAM